MKFDRLVQQIQSVQSVMQASAAHAINAALTLRNWLIGYYIVEFEQNGEDRAKYGEKLLLNLQHSLHTRGLSVVRLREFRRLYLGYPHIGDEFDKILPDRIIKQLSLNQSFGLIRRTSVESETENRRTSVECNGIPAALLLKRLPYSHLLLISSIDNPLKLAFYEFG